MESQTRGIELISNESGVQASTVHQHEISDPVDVNRNLNGERGVQASTVHQHEISDPVDANRNLNGERGVQASRHHPIVVPVPPDSENRVQASRECPVEVRDPVADIENGMLATDQARNRTSRRTLLLLAGGSIVLISGALLFPALFNLLSTLVVFVVFCTFFIGLMIIYLGVISA